MKKVLWISLCLYVPFLACGQQDDHLIYKSYDFSAVDASRLDKATLKKQIDSIYRNSGYDSLVQLLSFVHARETKTKYAAFFIGYQSTQASFGQMRSGLSNLGFSELSEEFSGIPFGFDIRGKKLLFSYYVVAGSKNKASNNDYTVEVDGFNFQLAFGYDLLPWKRLQFYPMAAVSVQGFDIDVKRKTATTDITDVNGLVLDPAGSSLRKTSFDLTYGAQLDYHLLYSANRTGIILGFRYAWVAPIAKGNFKINDRRSAFQPTDSVNESFFSVVLKIYGRM